MGHVLKNLRDLAERVAKAATPGSHLVEVIPLMKYLPCWLARWKREGLEHGRKDTQFFKDLNDDARIRAVSDHQRELRIRPNFCEEYWIWAGMHGCEVA